MQASGKFVGNERGFGFVLREGGEDIFIPSHFVSGALHGDEVICKLEPRREGRENLEKQAGKIIEITRRATMIGTFFTEGKEGFVRAVERKIPYIFSVAPKTISRFGLADGHRVIFSVDKRANPADRLAASFITEVLGHVNDPGMDVLTLVWQAGVPYEFPKTAMEEANAAPSEVSECEISGRLDLRCENIFTIDGDDTKDIDDAISFAETPDGYKLGVHIADVSHYVRQSSALDAAALNRGTSIYLADRVIPMLPHKLSSGICSLFPDVDRLTLSCIMNVNKNGDVTDYEISPSVINSKKRWTYTEVQTTLDTGENETLNAMDALRGILQKKRQKRGALDFNLPESKIRADENGKVISIEPYSRNNATGIIEEFMILCNETIAAHFLARKIPVAYRTHEPPSKEKLDGLQRFIQNLGSGQKLKTSKSPGTLQRLLKSAAETPAAYAISTAVLHALPQAHYTPDNPTHFGLASKAYCHFTSPIRRYADLQIHRIIKSTKNPEKFAEILHSVCAQCSRTERIAESLERDVAELKKAQFMEGMEGQIFDAIVSGITTWGMYVMLENTVEGLVPEGNLTRHRYKYNKEHGAYEKSKREKGEKERKSLRHGSPVTVRLTQVNADERKLTFVLQ